AFGAFNVGTFSVGTFNVSVFGAGSAIGDDALQADQAIAFIDANQAHALGVTTLHRDFADLRAHQGAARADQHALVFRLHQQSANHPTISLADLQCDHALTAPTMDREVLDRGPLAVAILGRGEHHALLIHDDERNHVFPGLLDAFGAGRR